MRPSTCGNGGCTGSLLYRLSLRFSLHAGLLSGCPGLSAGGCRDQSLPGASADRCRLSGTGFIRTIVRAGITISSAGLLPFAEASRCRFSSVPSQLTACPIKSLYCRRPLCSSMPSAMRTTILEPEGIWEGSISSLYSAAIRNSIINKLDPLISA